MSSRDSIGIGLMGLGVVGGGVARVLMDKSDALAKQVGAPLKIRKILERDTARIRASRLDESLFTTDASQVTANPDVDIVVEVLGGERPAFEFIMDAMARGKYVVTSNKEVMSKHFAEFLSLATEKGVDILYEASVGGGIPLIAPFKQDLAANEISAIHAIINGTTNYIVTRMTRDGLDFASALKQAQSLGYAEANPANDIEGMDAAYKLTILASLAFHVKIHPDDIYREGISRLSARDFRYAKELGYEIKLLAIGKEKNGSVEARVHPVLLPQDLLLAKVDGVFNAVQVEGDLVGRVIFYGQGAGALPTSSAVISDVIDLAQRIRRGVRITPDWRIDPRKTLKPISEIVSRYYLRLTVGDKPGVLAQITKIFGDNLISIASVIQKEADEKAQTAEIVIMTHRAREKAMQKALKETGQLPIVKEIGNFIRVED